MVKKGKSIISALGIITGTAMGAGFLGIPYVIAKSGFLIGACLLLLIGAFIMYLKLCLGEVILRTRGNHQMTGYAEKYLGKWGKLAMFLAMILGIFPALSAYLIAEGQTLSYVFSGGLSYAIYFSLGFWVLMAFFSYIGLTALKKFDRFGLFIVLGLVALILVFFFGRVNFTNLSYVNPSNFFMPVGVILFSFLAFSAMPEVVRVLHGNERLMKRTIILGMFIPFVVYFIFSFVVVGNFGEKTPEIATLALGRFSSILAVVTLFAGFFASSIAIRDMFRFDFKTGRFYGWMIAILVPLVLFLLITFFELVSFVQLLSLAGVVSGGLTGICVLLMNKRAKEKGRRKPEYSIKMSWLKIVVISALFITGVVLELVL